MPLAIMKLRPGSLFYHSQAFLVEKWAYREYKTSGVWKTPDENLFIANSRLVGRASAGEVQV